MDIPGNIWACSSAGRAHGSHPWGSRVRSPSGPPKQDNPNLAPVGGGFGFIFYLDKMAWTSSNIVSKQKNLFKKGARACAGAGSCCWSTAILLARNPQAECFQAILRGPNANAFTGDVRSVNQYIIFIHRAVTPFFRRFLLKSPTIYGTF